MKKKRVIVGIGLVISLGSGWVLLHRRQKDRVIL